MSRMYVIQQEQSHDAPPAASLVALLMFTQTSTTIHMTTPLFSADDGLVALHDVMNTLLNHTQAVHAYCVDAVASPRDAEQYQLGAVAALALTSFAIGVRGYKLPRAIIFAAISSMAYVLCPPALLTMPHAHELRFAFGAAMGLLFAYLQSVGLFCLWSTYVFYAANALLPSHWMSPMVRDGVTLYMAVTVGAALAKFARGPDNGVILILQTAPAGAWLTRYVATLFFPTIPALRWTLVPLMYVYGYLQMKHFDKHAAAVAKKPHAD
ncbi:hypothetical protein SDRG_02764 [Saprolegnia diclina VS20]|uniref:Uncharacterized protein n=1 Tax=Saprolegnia diclina (strain VS20) TaxID=1156394 RepID=T0QZH4_SAPDV|nr:hypothetical protein SDRG_02764 [Saprolegnia diclina VS20]EQC40111.1 hypothetical protein SDRG_02764 [Saprolegnia diclina VS20]|eukprot:XP_008606585.1 hypothetical protein SDRG_02764 [Saprolegnia diclina VS20]